MNIALFSPPPVGLILADDVIEGFPLDLCVLSRALQGNYMSILDKTSKNLGQTAIFMWSGRAFLIGNYLQMALDYCVHPSPWVVM